MDVNNFFLYGDLHEEVYMTPPSGLCRQGESNLITCATSFTVALIYVDDMVITDNDESAIYNLKYFLYNQFRIRDLGHLKYFLGLEIARSNARIAISQQKYTIDILDDAGLLGAQSVNFPMEHNMKLATSDGEVLNNPSRFRRLVGRLIYLTITIP
ncbi:unnamed protein product [Prunus armeniaca]